MRTAPFLTDFYIARIHGRAEFASTIVISRDDYRRVDKEEGYIDLVCHALTRLSCLFLGFSFVDPAIRHVLDMIKKRFDPEYPQLHLALLPEDADTSLAAKLAALNIRTVHYEVTNGHSALWEALKLASRELTRSEKTEKPVATFETGSMQRFLAASYARFKLKDHIHPLRDMVLDGMVMDMLATKDRIPVAVPEIVEELRRYLPLPQEDAERLVRRRITNLGERGLCYVVKDQIRSSRSMPNALDEDIGLLVKGVRNRLQVREGEAPFQGVEDVAAKCIEEVLLARSWDLSAHYAGAQVGELPNILSTVSASVAKHGSGLSDRQEQRLSRVCLHLFRRPNRQEAEILAHLGRVAFALQMVLHTPCSSVAREAVLPERVYLDTNVLMPAIVNGHPYRQVYIDAIRSLRQAAEGAGLSTEISVATSFLREIVSHREIAQREVVAMRLDDPEQLHEHIFLYGAEYANVFVGAYANWLGQERAQASFEDFLREVAPYDSVRELAAYLEKEGILTHELQFRSGDDADLYQQIEQTLRTAYRSDHRWRYKPKPTVLIDHEARQLTQLTLHLRTGSRALFVTADERLRKLAGALETRDPAVRRLGQAIISNRGLVQLVDLLLGLDTDTDPLARFIWGGALDDEGTIVREYLIDTGLQHYSDAIAMTMSEVLSASFVDQAVEDAMASSIDLFPGASWQSKSRTARFLDRLEDDFYATMAEVMRDRFPDHYPTVESIRRSNLQRQIQRIGQQIREYESRLPELVDTERTATKAELTELRQELDDYKHELESMQ
jgi:hypothetical protein